MIKIKNLTKSFGSFQAVSSIDLHIKKGTIFGLIGENGAGKTTLIQCLTGIYKEDKGEIKINDKTVYENPSVKKKIGYVADQNQYFPYFTIKDMVDFYDKTYPDFSKAKFDEYNKVFNLDANKRIRQLSKGMQMRLSLMLNLAINPDVLILDEPTSGLDAIAKNQMLDILLKEVLENKLTIFISSHHLGELERICDEIAIINRGQITYQSSLDDMKHNIKKLQVVYDKTPPKDLKDWEEIMKVDIVGRVHYLITEKYSKDLEKRLYDSGARFVDIIDLSLEEIFTYTYKGADK